jgi:hypothetical protein
MLPARLASLERNRVPQTGHPRRFRFVKIGDRQVLCCPDSTISRGQVPHFSLSLCLCLCSSGIDSDLFVPETFCRDVRVAKAPFKVTPPVPGSLLGLASQCSVNKVVQIFTSFLRPIFSTNRSPFVPWLSRQSHPRIRCPIAK